MKLRSMNVVRSKLAMPVTVSWSVGVLEHWPPARRAYGSERVMGQKKDSFKIFGSFFSHCNKSSGFFTGK